MHWLCFMLHHTAWDVRNGDAGISSFDFAHVCFRSTGAAASKLLLHATSLLGDVRRVHVDSNCGY